MTADTTHLEASIEKACAEIDSLRAQVAALQQQLADEDEGAKAAYFEQGQELKYHIDDNERLKGDVAALQVEASQDALVALVRQLADVYTVETDQVALIALVQQAKALADALRAPKLKK